MINNHVIVIVKSLLITCIISVAVAAICNQFYGASFLGTLLLTTVIQLTASWFFRTYIQFSKDKVSTEYQSKLLTQIESEATEAPCAYCGSINLIPISPENINDFECTECGEHNSVYVNITIAQKSVPIDAQPYEVTNFNQNLQSAKDKLLEDE